METVILTSLPGNVYGVVEYFVRRDEFLMKYSLNIPERNGNYRLWILSSRKPANSPLSVDVCAVGKGRAEGIAKFSSMDLGTCGFDPQDMDTFGLICESSTGLKVEASGFKYLRWEISYHTDRVYAKPDSNPVKRSEILLKRLKNKTTADRSFHRSLMAELRRAENRLKKSGDIPLKSYNWYIYDKEVYPLSFDIYAHVIDGMAKAYQKDSICLAGIGENGHTALCLKDRGTNPFLNAEDCSICVDGFWIVGVWLGEDGQYFEKISI